MNESMTLSLGERDPSRAPVAPSPGFWSSFRSWNQRASLGCLGAISVTLAGVALCAGAQAAPHRRSPRDSLPAAVPRPGSDGRVPAAIGDSATRARRAIDYPHEPAGFEKLTERDFSTRNPTGWLHIEDRYPGRLEVVPDDNPNVGPLVMEQRYPAGFQPGSGPATAEFPVRSPVTRLYISVWAKLSPNWQGHVSSTNKMFYVWIGGRPKVFISAEGVGSGLLEPQVRLQNDRAHRGRLRPNLARRAAVQRGVWQRWEFVFKANAPGRANGEVHWWINGVKVSQYHDVAYVDPGERPYWEVFQWRPIWGGSGGRPLAREQTLRFGHLYISGAP